MSSTNLLELEDISLLASRLFRCRDNQIEPQLVSPFVCDQPSSIRKEVYLRSLRKLLDEEDLSVEQGSIMY